MSNAFYEEVFGVSGRVALVTGGSRGIGEMIADGLVRGGATTYISSRKAEACAAVEARLNALEAPGTCIAIPGDVSSVEGVDALAAAIAEREPRLDILVNNAGLSWSASIDDFPEKAWDRVADVNVKGPFFLTQRLLPLLRAAASAERPASVVNIGSVGGLAVADLDNFSYTASKAGLHMLTRELAHVLAKDHVNVNCIAPGLYKSMMTAPLLASEDLERRMLAKQPMGRWGRMEDIAGLVIFLSSSAGSFLTGAIIASDGGMSTHG